MQSILTHRMGSFGVPTRSAPRRRWVVAATVAAMILAWAPLGFGPGALRHASPATSPTPRAARCRAQRSWPSTPAPAFRRTATTDEPRQLQFQRPRSWPLRRAPLEQNGFRGCPSAACALTPTPCAASDARSRSRPSPSLSKSSPHPPRYKPIAPTWSRRKPHCR